MKKALLSIALGAVALATPSVALAQDESVNTGGLSLVGNLDFMTSYFFRGYNQMDTGVIAAPAATVYIKAYESDNFLITPYVGTWNLLDSKQTGDTPPLGNGSDTDIWYESDWYGGIDWGFNPFVLSTIYTIYTYPASSFNTVQELGAKLTYDDTAFMKDVGVPFALKPYVAYYYEVAGSNSDPTGDESQYAEIGIAPSFAAGPVTITIPAILGMSTDGYYRDDDGSNELFGYTSVGLVGAIPLPFPARYGAWNLNGGVNWIQLYANSAETANDGGENYEIQGRLGIGFTY